MLSFVQHLGRIRKAKQGRDALLQLLFISDLSADEKARHAEDAKITCARLKENGLVGDAKEFIAFCTPMALGKYVSKSGCRMANLLTTVGGSKKHCGRCDNCAGGCTFTSNILSSRARSDASKKLRNKFIKLREVLESVCLVCKSESCDGTKCLKSGCFKCGRTGDYGHKSRDCLGSSGRYLKNLPVCQGCLCWKDDQSDPEQCKDFRCKMKHRLLRVYQEAYYDRTKHGSHGTPNDNGESFQMWMLQQYSDKNVWYGKLFDLLDKKNIKWK